MVQRWVKSCFSGSVQHGSLMFGCSPTSLQASHNTHSSGPCLFLKLPFCFITIGVEKSLPVNLNTIYIHEIVLRVLIWDAFSSHSSSSCFISSLMTFIMLFYCEWLRPHLICWSRGIFPDYKNHLWYNLSSPYLQKRLNQTVIKSPTLAFVPF